MKKKGLMPVPVSLAFFFDAGRFAGKVAQVVEFSPADDAPAGHFDFLDPRRVDGEGPFDADTIGYPADGECFAGPAALPPDDGAFENLDALAVAFHDFDVDANGVARLEGGNIAAHLFLFECFDNIQGVFLLILDVHAAAAADRPFYTDGLYHMFAKMTTIIPRRALRGGAARIVTATWRKT